MTHPLLHRSWLHPVEPTIEEFGGMKKEVERKGRNYRDVKKEELHESAFGV